MSKQSDSIKADILTRYMKASSNDRYMGDSYGRGKNKVRPASLDRWLEFEKLTVGIKRLERLTVETGTGKIQRRTSLCYNDQNMIGEWWPRNSKIPPSKGVTNPKEADSIIYWLVASGIMSRSVERIINPDCLKEIAAKREDTRQFIEETKRRSEMPRLIDLSWHLLDKDDKIAIVKHSDSSLQYSNHLDSLQAAARWFADRLLNQTPLLCLTLYHDMKDTAKPVSVKCAYGTVKDDEQLVNFLEKRNGKKVDGTAADKWLAAAAKNIGLETTAAVWPRTEAGLNPAKETTIDKIPGSIEDAQQIIRYLRTYCSDNEDGSAAQADDLQHYELNENNIAAALAYLQRQNHYNADEDCAILWLLSRGKQLAGILTRIILLRNEYRSDQHSDYPVIEEHLACFCQGQPQNAEDWLRGKLDEFNSLFSKSSESRLRTLKLWQHYDCSWDSEDRRLKHEPPLYSRRQGIILADGINNDMTELIASHFLPEPANVNRLMKCFSVYNPSKSNYKYAEGWLKRRRQVLRDGFAKTLSLKETRGENWQLVRKVNDAIFKPVDSDSLRNTKVRRGALRKWLDGFIKGIEITADRRLTAKMRRGALGKSLDNHLKGIELAADRYLTVGDEAAQKDKEALVEYISLYDPRTDHTTYAMLWILSLAQPLTPESLGS